jgi:DNA-binding XRE family transcriptional regulator
VERQWRRKARIVKGYPQLRSKMTPTNQAKAAKRAASMAREMPLYELRAARRLSQETLAEVLETSQSSISKIERRPDVYVSTLRRYVEAMGGRLKIVAEFPDETVKINQYEDTERRR